tara:strand:- start:1050 stop:2093 length:1044 start_codon:yes stop_codon:yes gene_type:complete
MNNSNLFNEWRELILNSDISENDKDKKLDLVAKAIENEVPVILDVNHLAHLLGLRVGILYSMVRHSNSFYRTFYIPKKRGGKREIVTPHQSLLEVQRWILNNILIKVKENESAFAYVKNKNVALNARLHIGAKEMLKVDIVDFFPSIKIPRVREIFNRLGYGKEVSLALSKLCTINDYLPQGASTSPKISNIILFKLDKRLSKIAEISDLKYSRYADDLIFSGEQIISGFKAFIYEIIEEEGFTINESKTRVFKEGSRKIVTGIVVNDNDIRLPKKKRKSIKHEVYLLKKYGIINQINKNKDIFYIDRILGKLSFWKQIEPDNTYVSNTFRQINQMYNEVLNPPNLL